MQILPSKFWYKRRISPFTKFNHHETVNLLNLTLKTIILIRSLTWNSKFWVDDLLTQYHSESLVYESHLTRSNITTDGYNYKDSSFWQFTYIYLMFQSGIADDIKIKNKLKTKNIDSIQCILFVVIKICIIYHLTYFSL